MQSLVQYSRSLPKRSLFPQETVLFYDSILVQNKATRAWLNQFQYRFSLQAGESLKTLESLKKVLIQIQSQNIPQTTELTFVAVGGGSIGDFVGFLASVYLRGRRLIHIPSTWLAALDSAHGGKNGINFLKVKNQLGQFYVAEKIYICESLLKTQPEQRLQEAMGEALKTALIDSAMLFEFFENKNLNLSFKDFFKILPLLIEKKYKIVQQDPYEKKGLRRVLNLGHTIGHVLEAELGWPHGVAVMHGLLFSVRYSYAKKILNKSDFLRLSALFESLNIDLTLHQGLNQISAERFAKHLLKDKKRTSTYLIDFIFVKRLGQVVRKPVSLNEILAEIKRQSLR